MSNNLNAEIVFQPAAHKESVIHVERVWQHRHDLELRTQKPGRNRLLTLLLGTGVIALGATFMLANIEQGPTHALVPSHALASHPARQASVAKSTNHQDTVDKEPTQIKVAELQSRAAYAVVPTKRPAFEQVRPQGPNKTDLGVSTASAASVVRYDQCAPNCETRDPLVVGMVPTISTVSNPLPTDSLEIEPTNQAGDVGKAVIDGAGFVLVQTAGLPLTTLRLGRSAAVRMSDLD